MRKLTQQVILLGVVNAGWGVHASSMSASFQPPGPAKRARPAVSSRFSTTSAQVASISMLMSLVVRHMCPTCTPAQDAWSPSVS